MDAEAQLENLTHMAGIWEERGELPEDYMEQLHVATERAAGQ